jgi:hypothetical protein
VASLALWAIPRGAAAEDTKAACLSAHVDGQKLRRAGKLLTAQERFHACAADACPALVRGECVTWLAELVDSQPSIVVAARDAQGHDLSLVTLYVDGVKVTDRLSGVALPIDPGEHALLFTDPQHEASVEEHIVVREGERARQVDVVLPLPRERPREDRAPTPTGPGIPVATYAATALGVIALGVFAGAGISFHTRYGNLESRCAPSCSEADLKDIQRDAVLADAALGTAVVAFGVALVTFLMGSRTTRGAAFAPSSF